MINKSDNVIEVENLVTYYGDREILKGVTLDVRDGEIIEILRGERRLPCSAVSTLIEQFCVSLTSLQ